MGQAGNSKRHASLDDQKERAAGRHNELTQIKAAVMPREKGRAGGAFGADQKSNRGGGAGRPTRAAGKRKTS